MTETVYWTVIKSCPCLRIKPKTVSLLHAKFFATESVICVKAFKAHFIVFVLLILMILGHPCIKRHDILLLTHLRHLQTNYQV